MPTITESGVISASRERVWDLLTNADAILQWFEGLDTVVLSPNYPEAGATLDWTYKVMGIEFKGTNTSIAADPGSLISLKMDGLMSGQMDYRLTDTPDGTRLELEVEYRMSGGALGKLAEPVVHRMNAGNAKKSLDNLKALAERG